MVVTIPGLRDRLAPCVLAPLPPAPPTTELVVVCAAAESVGPWLTWVGFVVDEGPPCRPAAGAPVVSAVVAAGTEVSPCWCAPAASGAAVLAADPDALASAGGLLSATCAPASLLLPAA